ncbi:hypothetical protein OPV22_027327 [Ensete ventricosum]|uniref:Uncharacterized protein n=1 Tax=Ensete ventricosum TaxID=4639 RepID=A0AAV8PRS1_ENSVE|nr:hypothetical protein OPV22_027327 [Ensete ventricosum]
MGGVVVEEKFGRPPSGSPGGDGAAWLSLSGSHRHLAVVQVELGEDGPSRERADGKRPRLSCVGSDTVQKCRTTVGNGPTTNASRKRA